MMFIGVDYHPSFQTIAFFMEETGECGEQELKHSGLWHRHRLACNDSIAAANFAAQPRLLLVRMLPPDCAEEYV